MLRIKAGKENGSYRVVPIFNGVVKKGLTKKLTFEAKKQEPCWEHCNRQEQ